MLCAPRVLFNPIIRPVFLLLLLAASLISCGPGNPINDNGASSGSGGGGGGTGGGGGGGGSNVALISGGQTGPTQSPTANAALYDSSANNISPTGNMVDPRVYFTLTLLPDGTVLAAGGNTAAAAKLRKYSLRLPGLFSKSAT